MKHNIDSCFIDSVIKKDLFESSLKKTNFIIDEIKKSKNPLLLAFLNQFSNYGKKKINKFNDEQITIKINGKNLKFQSKSKRRF